MICDKIQTSTSLWYWDLDTVIKKNGNIFQVKISYYKLSYDGIQKKISMNPYDHLESEQSIIGGKETFSY